MRSVSATSVSLSSRMLAWAGVVSSVTSHHRTPVVCSVRPYLGVARGVVMRHDGIMKSEDMMGDDVLGGWSVCRWECMRGDVSITDAGMYEWTAGRLGVQCASGVCTSVQDAKTCVATVCAAIDHADALSGAPGAHGKLDLAWGASGWARGASRIFLAAVDGVLRYRWDVGESDEMVMSGVCDGLGKAKGCVAVMERAASIADRIGAFSGGDTI